MEKITTAASVSAAWRGMSDEEQYTALQKMAWTVRRGGSKRGAEWIQTQDDAMNVAAHGSEWAQRWNATSGPTNRARLT